MEPGWSTDSLKDDRRVKEIFDRLVMFIAYPVMSRELARLTRSRFSPPSAIARSLPGSPKPPPRPTQSPLSSRKRSIPLASSLVPSFFGRQPPRVRWIRSDKIFDKLNFISLMLALFAGTASLPHILIRYYTVKDQDAARRSTIVGIASIGFFYILTLYIGLGAMTSGALDVTNNNMAAPLLAKSFNGFLFAMISAIAFTTVLGTVSGLIIASAGTVVHDLVPGLTGMTIPDGSKVRVARIVSVLVGIIAMALGIVFEKLNVSYLVGWAFSIAASANLPALVMILFWKRTTREGIIAAVTVGMLSSLLWILASADTFKSVYGWAPEHSPVPFSQPGIVTIPLGFVVLIVVSLISRRPPLTSPASSGMICPDES